MEPREAARLLTQTQADARRAWIPGALGSLVGGGGAGRFRDRVAKRPRSTPLHRSELASLAVFYVLIALRIATVIYAYTRARTGVSGRSVKVQRDEAVALTGVLVVCYLALIRDRERGSHGPGFYWSLFLNGTLIALAAVWAGRCAIHKRWHEVALTASGRADRCPRRNCRPSMACGSSTEWGSARCCWSARRSASGSGARLGHTRCGRAHDRRGARPADSRSGAAADMAALPPCPRVTICRSNASRTCSS